MTNKTNTYKFISDLTAGDRIIAEGLILTVFSVSYVRGGFFRISFEEIRPNWEYSQHSKFALAR